MDREGKLTPSQRREQMRAQQNADRTVQEEGLGVILMEGAKALTGREVIKVVKDVFHEMHYEGEPPAEIRISGNSVILPEDQAQIEACYSADNPQEGEARKPGKILLGEQKCIDAFGERRIGVPDYYLVAAFAAREAVDHVNWMRGKVLATSRRRLSTEERKSDTTREANEIARKVIRDRYDFTVTFGDEQRTE